MEQNKHIGRKYLIDTGAVSFGVTNSIINQFRMIANLEDDVDLTLLQTAVDLTLPRYPMFSVRYSKGIGCILRATTVKERVLIEPLHTQFKLINIFEDSPNLKVYYQERAVIVEMYHSITDANGGMEFLNTLLGCYMKLKGEKFSEEGIIPYDSEIAEEEFSDCYVSHARRGKTAISTTNLGKCVKLPGEKLTTQANDVFLKLHFDSSCFKPLREKTGATVHEILVTTLYLAYLEIKKRHSLKEPIRVQMAINMRGRLKAVTLRNFVGVVQFATKQTDFENILKELKDFMAIATSEDELRKFVNVGKTLIKILLPIAPAPLGRFFVRGGEKLVGEGGFSTNLSNLGIIKHSVPGIKSYDFLLAPPLEAPFYVTAVAYKDVCSLAFSRHVDNDEFETEFIKILAGLNIIPTSAEYSS